MPRVSAYVVPIERYCINESLVMKAFCFTVYEFALSDIFTSAQPSYVVVFRDLAYLAWPGQVLRGRNDFFFWAIFEKFFIS